MTRYATRADALAAINPAHDPWPFISYPATWNIGFAVSTCRRCHEMLAVSDSTTGRIQLTDAAHEAVCVPFGGEDASNGQ